MTQSTKTASARSASVQSKSVTVTPVSVAPAVGWVTEHPVGLVGMCHIGMTWSKLAQVGRHRWRSIGRAPHDPFTSRSYHPDIAPLFGRRAILGLARGTGT